MHRRRICALLAFALLVGDAATLLASLRAASASPDQSNVTAEPNTERTENTPEDHGPRKRPARQVLSEQAEEGDSIDVQGVPGPAIAILQCRRESFTSFARCRRHSVIAVVSTHLRI